MCLIKMEGGFHNEGWFGINFYQKKAQGEITELEVIRDPGQIVQPNNAPKSP